MTKDEMDIATKGFMTKSAKIRVLDKLGATRSEIANYLQIRYQHVRNVLISPAPLSSNGNGRGNLPAPSTAGDTLEGTPLSIEEAKRGLAINFGVSPSMIEITIRG